MSPRLSLCPIARVARPTIVPSLHFISTIVLFIPFQSDACSSVCYYSTAVNVFSIRMICWVWVLKYGWYISADCPPFNESRLWQKSFEWCSIFCCHPEFLAPNANPHSQKNHEESVEEGWNCFNHKSITTCTEHSREFNSFLHRTKTGAQPHDSGHSKVSKNVI